MSEKTKVKGSVFKSKEASDRFVEVGAEAIRSLLGNPEASPLTWEEYVSRKPHPDESEISMLGAKNLLQMIRDAFEAGRTAGIVNTCQRYDNSLSCQELSCENMRSRYCERHER